MTLVQFFQAGLWSFGASACCAVYFNAEKKDVFWGAVLGAAGWIVYSAVKSSGGDAAFGYFAGAFTAAVAAEFLAVVARRPATVYLVPGIIPLVPGGGIFYMMRGVVKGEFSEALSAGYGALTAAVAMALGIAIAASAARIVTMVIRRKKYGCGRSGTEPCLPEDIDV